MDLERIKPWNWFKHEDQLASQIPVSKNDKKTTLSQSASEHPLMHLHREMDRLFDNVWRSFGVDTQSGFSRMPSLFDRELASNSLLGDYRVSLDIAGSDNEYEVSVDLPGLTEDDIKVEVTGNVLTVRGQKEDVSENKEKQFYRMERSYGSFQRTLSLPDDANSSDITASMKDGVLKITVPRRETEKADVKRIPIGH
ncbi:MAG: Hsp20/alpha crystallin family protein [Reinekea sp.]|jgi:HSP20 family protein